MTDEPTSQATARRVIDQAGEAADLAKRAFANGDLAHGIAALQLAAQLVQLAKIQERMKP